MKPQDLNVNEYLLTVTWTDDVKTEYPASFLRAMCQCASCVSEVTGETLIDRKALMNKTSLRFASAEPQGHYAIALGFSDGHNSGIFTFEYLNKIKNDIQKGEQSKTNLS